MVAAEDEPSRMQDRVVRSISNGTDGRLEPKTDEGRAGDRDHQYQATVWTGIKGLHLCVCVFYAVGRGTRPRRTMTMVWPRSAAVPGPSGSFGYRNLPPVCFSPCNGPCGRIHEE